MNAARSARAPFSTPTITPAGQVMRCVWWFEHAGCTPVRVTLVGRLSEPEQLDLLTRLSSGALPAGLREQAPGTSEFAVSPPENGLLLVAELSGCEQAKHAVFELADAL